MTMSNVLAAAVIGGAYVAGQSMVKPSETEDKTAQLEQTITSLRGSLAGLSAQLEAASIELASQKEAYQALKELYDNTKAEGGLTEELVMSYEATIAKLSERMQFLSSYLSAEIERSVEHVASHAIPKMPGLYIDPEVKFSDASRDPSLFYGPNGDVRLHNTPVLDFFPTLFYQDAKGEWTTTGVTHSGSAYGRASFRLMAGKKMRLQCSHPSALGYKDMGLGVAFPGAPSNYDADVEERKFFDSWMVIEFEEDFNLEGFFSQVSVNDWRRYDDNGTPRGAFTENPRHVSSHTIIPLRKNVILVKCSACNDADYKGYWVSDFGIAANTDVDVVIKSVNAVYLPWYAAMCGVSTYKVAGKYASLPGPCFKKYNDKMKVI